MDIKGYLTFLEENEIPYETNVSMKAHTTFRIGGAADVFVRPAGVTAAAAAVRAAAKYSVPYFILGNGSNILVSDMGIEGAVIDMSGVCGVTVKDGKLLCGAGESLRKVCTAARNASLSGLEFAYGIPGTVGGAFYMNAGAYGGEIADAAVSAVCLDNNLEICTVEKKDMNFGYRTSVFKTANLIILSVVLQLKSGDKAEITRLMNDVFARRQEKQPLNYPSAGSTFKRPAGYYAGALIEQAGLKGRAVGGAMVSEKHAGFIVNYNNATARDVLSLIDTVKETVKQNSGVTLCEEILFTGRR